MRIGGKVDDCVDLVLPHGCIHRRRFTDIGVDEGVTLPETFDHVNQVVQVPGIGQFVIDDDFVVRVPFQHIAGKVGADEAGSTGHK